MTPIPSDDPKVARFKVDLSRRAQIRMAVELWIDRQRTTRVGRYDVHDPISRERAIETFIDMFLAIGEAVSEVARDKALADPEFVAMINQKIADADARVPKLKQVGWHGPYGVIPGGMGVHAMDDWVPIYIKVERG